MKTNSYPMPVCLFIKRFTLIYKVTISMTNMVPLHSYGGTSFVKWFNNIFTQQLSPRPHCGHYQPASPVTRPDTLPLVFRQDRSVLNFNSIQPIVPWHCWLLPQHHTHTRSHTHTYMHTAKESIELLSSHLRSTVCRTRTAIDTVCGIKLHNPIIRPSAEWYIRQFASIFTRAPGPRTAPSQTR